MTGALSDALIYRNDSLSAISVSVGNCAFYVPTGMSGDVHIHKLVDRERCGFIVHVDTLVGLQ